MSRFHVYVVRTPFFFPLQHSTNCQTALDRARAKKCTSIALPTPDLFISLCAKPACATIFQPCGFLLSQPSCRAGRAIQGLSNFSSFSPPTTDRQFATLARIISSAIPCKKTASVCVRVFVLLLGASPLCRGKVTYDDDRCHPLPSWRWRWYKFWLDSGP